MKEHSLPVLNLRAAMRREKFSVVNPPLATTCGTFKMLMNKVLPERREAMEATGSVVRILDVGEEYWKL